MPGLVHRGYLLSRLPEVPRVGEPPIQLGQLLQHFHQQGEAGPLLDVESPAGRQDLLQAELALVGVRAGWQGGGHSWGFMHRVPSTLSSTPQLRSPEHPADTGLTDRPFLKTTEAPSLK